MSKTTYLEASAHIDITGRYRYNLVRAWDHALPRCCFLMFNPSTADGTQDDPTIRRCVGFAKHWGYGSLEVVNLFAYRATKPSDVLNAPCHRWGVENNEWIMSAMGRSDIVVAAYGAIPTWATDRAREVLALIPRHLFCLQCTKDGYPRHPLYVPKDTPLITFRDAWLTNIGSAP